MTLRDDTMAVRGREIRFWRGGAGHSLLFLHDAWAYRWLPIHDRLATHYDVVLPIHPGFSGSSGFEEMDRQVEIAAAAFTVLPSTGHLPHIEHPETLANAVLEYLERR